MYIFYWIPEECILRDETFGDNYGYTTISLPTPQIIAPKYMNLYFGRRSVPYVVVNPFTIYGGITQIPIYGELKPVRSSMIHRGKKWVSIVQKLKSNSEFDIYSDIKYVLLPDFEIIDWRETAYRPWVERHSRKSAPAGVNKRRFCFEYTETKSSFPKITRWHEEDVFWEDILGDEIRTVSYTIKDDGGWTKTGVRPDCLKRNWNFKNWKHRTKYRKQYEKNIRNHIDTYFVKRKKSIEKSSSENDSCVFSDSYEDKTGLQLYMRKCYVSESGIIENYGPDFIDKIFE